MFAELCLGIFVRCESEGTRHIFADSTNIAERPLRSGKTRLGVKSNCTWYYPRLSVKIRVKHAVLAG